MINNDLKKIISYIFFPALLLSLLFSVVTTFCSPIQNNILLAQTGLSQIASLQVLTVGPSIIFVLVLLAVSKSKPFEKIFRGTLITFIGLISILIGCIYFQKSLGQRDFFEVVGIHQLIIAHWPSFSLLIVFKLIQFALFPLLIWGFINRVTCLLDGKKYYIPLAFTLGLIGGLTKLVNLLRVYNWPLMLMLAVIVALMSFALIIFNWAWKRLPDNFIHPEESPVNRSVRFPFLSAAYLLTGGLIVNTLLNILLKSQLKTQFSDPTSYARSMGQYSFFVGFSGLVISVLWATLGFKLLLKRGWRTTALNGSLSILLGGIFFLTFSSVGKSSSWLSQGVFAGILTGTTGALLFPLVQMLYLYMPFQARFKAKVMTEMIALPLMKSMPAVGIQGLVFFMGSVNSAIPYFKVLIPILIVLLVIASTRAGSRFSSGRSISAAR